MLHKPKEDPLKFIISKMGVPLRQSQQKYEYMESSYKKHLNENVARLIENGILDDIFVTEFQHQLDNKNRLSSLDVVRMANALLTCPADFTGKGRLLNNLKNLIKGIFQWQLINKIKVKPKFLRFWKVKKVIFGYCIINF